ncbi:hypothetical protein [Actinokineospora alba]|uniref:hypothetical protein n=1 Tax=Actinokineospora alba TaxID=504798 RepID=UPI00105B6FAB|nr:hypothetical protein [Actinokineospora alba]
MLTIADALAGRPAPLRFQALTATVRAGHLGSFLSKIPEIAAGITISHGDYPLTLFGRDYAVPGLAMRSPKTVLVNRAELIAIVAMQNAECEARFEPEPGTSFLLVRGVDSKDRLAE